MTDDLPASLPRVLEVQRKLRLIRENLGSFDLARLDAELERLLEAARINPGGLGYDLRSYLYLALSSDQLTEPVSELPYLSDQTKKLLLERIIETLEDLLEHSEAELLRQRYFGPAALAEVSACLADYEPAALYLSRHDEHRPDPPPRDEWVHMSVGTEHERWVLRSRIPHAAVFDLEEQPYPDYRILRHLAQNLRITRVSQLMATGRRALLTADWEGIRPVLTTPQVGAPYADPAEYAVEHLAYLLGRYDLSLPD